MNSLISKYKIRFLSHGGGVAVSRPLIAPMYFSLRYVRADQAERVAPARSLARSRTALFSQQVDHD
jgi:hypothetical protein